MAAKSQPLAVGDRVHNCRAGAGTVTALVPLDGGVAHYRVRFDASTERNVASAKYLERLIPGDEGFEPPAIPREVPTCPWDRGVRASDVPIASRTVKTQNNYDDEF